MKSVLLFFLLFINVTNTVPNKDIVEIKRTITCFFEWDKIKDRGNLSPKYSITKTIKRGNKKKIEIDKDGVELYLNKYRESHLFSELYLNNLRGYFYKMGKDLDKDPEIEADAIIKTDGLDLDIPLQSFEPELILDHYKKGLFKKIVIVSNKSIVQFYISKYQTKMIFTLTKEKGKWFIDTIDYYD